MTTLLGFAIGLLVGASMVIGALVLGLWIIWHPSERDGGQR